MIDYTLLGKRISFLRKKQALTQEHLSELAGISNNYLSNIENCHSIPSLETVINICSALNVTPDSILIGINSNTDDYMNQDICQKISKCTDKEKRLINGFIDLIIKER